MPQQQIYVIIYPLLTAWADHYTLIRYIHETPLYLIGVTCPYFTLCLNYFTLFLTFCRMPYSITYATYSLLYVMLHLILYLMFHNLPYALVTLLYIIHTEVANPRPAGYMRSSGP